MNLTRRIVFPLVLVVVTVLPILSAVAAEPSPYGKTTDGWYLGGTSGRSGIDSLRGYVDSIFYAKAAQSLGSETVGDPEGVIYGDDDRRDIYTLTDPNLLKLAQAACVIVESYEISNNGDGTYTLNTSPWTTQGGYPLCAGERFVGQRQIGYCSGFLVGQDIVVTAGHCVDACTGVAFVFGFEQVDSLTPPVTVVSADNVYFCSQVIEQRLQGDLDHSVIRLDRSVVGRTPIPIRRDGLVEDGAPLVLVGHPTVLPLKAAAGAEVKNNNGTSPWFQANTDSYGGNSGSMVVNTNTWKIEGILVRGAPDFVINGGCVRSNVVPNSGNPGSGLEFEEISKITTVAQLIPELLGSAGELSFNAAAYPCTGSIAVELRDQDLAGLGSLSLPMVTSAADSETVALTESPSTQGIFTGSISTLDGGPIKWDGSLQVSDAVDVTATYTDADHGSGTPATVIASATIDCSSPQITNVTVAQKGVTWVRVTFSTDEAASGQVRVGSTCGTFVGSGAGSSVIDHDITVNGLLPATSYRFEVEASDLAGNTTTDDNAGACFEFITDAAVDCFTEQFISGFDLQGKTLALVPDGSPQFYRACFFDSPNFPPASSGETGLALADDAAEVVTLADGKQVSLYGVNYNQVYICTNGFVTFDAENTDWSETLAELFDAPPRVAVFWDDLDLDEGGTISYKQFDNRLLITWRGVHAHLSPFLVNAQLALYFDGALTMTYGTVQESDCIVGISRGTGMPADFIPSDMSSYPDCEKVICYIDADNDSFGANDDLGYARFSDQCLPGTVDNNLDCDDTNPNRPPGVVDVPDGGIDQDCDGRDASCCVGRVGDANSSGEDEPTIGDISLLIDHLFISGVMPVCLREADVNQSGGRYPTVDDITIGDISVLIDHLFISGVELSNCL